ncbi:MAG: PAS domain S-box protein [Pelotomaculum sp.]|nr:PAS domain S-box protein [Pelotomaculum sp.]
MADLTDDWLRLAAEQMPLGLLAVDREGRVRVFNRVLSGLTGLRQDEVLERPFRKVFDCREPGLNKLLQTLATGREFKDLQPGAIIPNLELANYTASTHAISGEGGHTAGAMALFLPAGRLQELENAVIKAERLAILGQLAAGMVHEIRNPLTVIGGFMQLLQKLLDGNPKEKYIHIILAELKHVNNLISEFLQLAKPGCSRRAPCSIEKLIKDVVMLVESEAYLRKLEIDLAVTGGIPPVMGDGEQLKQVFLNFIKNSFDALSPGGKLVLETAWDRREGFVRIVFKDNGAGMDEETLKSIFNPFFTTKENGTGLGMFINKKIIDNHGGRIEIQSEQGKGTTVTVLLPAI